MAFVLTEEQALLQTSAAEFFQEKSPVSELRRIRDERIPRGFNPGLWEEMAEMGWTALTIPERYGGLDFGYTGFGQVLREAGRTLCASPLIPSVLMSAAWINLAGTETQKQELLPGLADGSLIMSMAFEEGARHHPLKCRTTAVRNGESYVLNGVKRMVLMGERAGKWIVTADCSGQFSSFLVDADLPGIQIKSTTTMDSLPVSEVQFINTEIPVDDRLEGSPAQFINQFLPIAYIGISSEHLGVAEEAFSRTISYLQERKQFNVPIGSFQALQHRAAHLYCEIEICKSMLLKGLRAIDECTGDLAIIGSMVKAKISETASIVTNEAIQMFGGIGMTDDEEIGFFMKRSKVLQALLGDVSYHLDRFASLHDF